MYKRQLLRDPAALMGPPDAGHPAEEGVRAPSAKTIVAVGALRPGIGCTHLAVALGIELASCNRSAAVALRDRAQLNRCLLYTSDRQMRARRKRWK